MAVQQRRVSKTRKAKRRTHYKLYAPTLVVCPSCGEFKKPHYRCSCEVEDPRAERRAAARAEKK